MRKWCWALAALASIFTAGGNCFDPVFFSEQELGLVVAPSVQRGPQEKVLGSRLKSEVFPVLGLRYQYLAPSTWYINGRMDWLFYRLGDSSSSKPKKTFYDAEFSLGYTFQPDLRVLGSLYIGVGKTINRVKHQNLVFQGKEFSDGAFYILRRWWYPVLGGLLSYEVNRDWFWGIRLQVMPMLSKAKISVFAESEEDKELVDELAPDLRAEREWNFFLELPVTYRVPYGGSSWRLAPFLRTYINGRLLGDGKVLSNKKLGIGDGGVYLEYLLRF